jgi:thioredoxin reductase (NADPH)
MLADFRIGFGEDIEIDIINVDSEPALRAAYGTRVPVLVGSEGELCHYRLDEQAVADYLERAAT